MGLDARVYCACFESGQLREPPPYPDLVCVAEYGAPDIDSEDLDLSVEHDRWEASGPCRHAGFVLLHHHLGNAALIGRLRATVSRFAPRSKTGLGIVCNRVLYSGIHTGDWLAIEQVRSLRAEIEELRALLESAEPEEQAHLAMFCQQMSELIAASLQVGKPLAF